MGLGLRIQVGVRVRVTLTFNSRRAIVMSHIHAKGQGQRSVSSKIEWKQMDCITCHANAVSKDVSKRKMCTNLATCTHVK